MANSGTVDVRSGRPLPAKDADSAPYWAAARSHALSLPRCEGCGEYAFPPKQRCPRCLSKAFTWTELSGRATLYSYSVAHMALYPGFQPPYVIALVELEEQPGLHITTNLLDCPLEDVVVGMPLEVTFEDVSDDYSLPQFRPRGAPARAVAG
jgi:uncharacterized OB-fold protein